MERRHGVMMAVAVLLVIVLAVAFQAIGWENGAFDRDPVSRNDDEADGIIDLPRLHEETPTDLDAFLASRRSVRTYAEEPVESEAVSRLLWAAQGINDPARGFRTAPSAGALYPLEVYLIVGEVPGLAAGVYRYQPDGHQLKRMLSGDVRGKLAQAALGQDSVRRAPAVMVVSGFYERTTIQYGERGERYVHLEAGHAAQNLCLQVEALDLACVVIGAFRDEEVREALQLDEDETPLYLIPVGHPQS